MHGPSSSSGDVWLHRALHALLPDYICAVHVHLLLDILHHSQDWSSRASRCLEITWHNEACPTWVFHCHNDCFHKWLVVAWLQWFVLAICIPTSTEHDEINQFPVHYYVHCALLYDCQEEERRDEGRPQEWIRRNAGI